LKGTFSVEMLPYGRYEVIATRGIATLQQDVEVRDSFCLMNLRLDTSDLNGAPNRDGLVSVAELKIPPHAREAYQKARAELLKNHPEKVSGYLAKALQLCPAYAPALTLRGLLSLDNGDVSAAVNDFDNAIRADSTYAQAHSAMAKAFNRLHKFDEALRAAERASALAPSSWQPYFEMAKSYIAKTDFSRALQQLAHAQSQLPEEYAPIHFVRASALLGLQNYDDAAAELKSFLRVAPKTDPNIAAAQDALTHIQSFVAAQVTSAENRESR
jgi:tetratricopeptide (TPR) repeat protein